ncbi:MAG: TonB-dependent receptor [Treponema sp.]|nr:TonB-dependent receptor [Treponema sp.]
MKFLRLLLFISFPLFSQDTFYEDEFIYFFEGDDITVVGTIPVTQQITVVEKEQIVQSGASDIVNLLHETLGLNIVRYGAYGNRSGINLRGFDSKRIVFLINGVQVNSSMDGRFDISQIDINSIERIEVIYGGSDSKYNVTGAFGGIVNIITVRKQEERLRFTASVSNTSSMPGEYRGRDGLTHNARLEDLFDTQNYSLSASYGGGLFSMTANIYANRAENHYLFTDHYNYTRRKDNNEVWDAGASVSFVRELPDLIKLIFSSSLYYGDKNFPLSGFSSYTGNQMDFSSLNNFMLDMPRAFHDDFSTKLSLSYQFNILEYTSPSMEVSLHNQHDFAAVNRWNWYSDKFTAGSGIDFRYINLDSTEIGNRKRHDGGFYLTFELKPVKSLLIIPSSKIIFTSEGSSNIALIPKLGILWNVTDNIALRNNYFRNFKFPDFEELYWSGTGNPDLRSEDGWGADIGVSWHITEMFKLEGVFFTQWIKDSIHWFSQSGGVWRPENVGEAFLFGFDSNIYYEHPVLSGILKKISASISYKYLTSFLLSYGYTFNSGKRIPYNPKHTFSGTMEFFWDSGSISISGHYESLRYHDTANLTELKPYFLLNAGINQKIGKYIIISGTVRNILNTSYESFYDYPMPGVTMTLGFRANINTNRIKGE